MIRFASEEKFWEIGLERSAVITRTGKHDTKGRASRTSVASPEAGLQLLMDRVAKKRKEDAWTEVPMVFDRSVDFSPYLRGDEPTGPWSATPGEHEVGEDAVEQFLAAVQRDRALLEKGLELEGQPGWVGSYVRQILDGSLAAIGCDGAALGLVLAMVPKAVAVDAMVTLHGLEEVVRAMKTRMRLRTKSTLYARGFIVGDRDLPDALIARLRALLWSAEEPTRQAAMAVARAPGGLPHGQIDVAMLFPETAWVHELVQDLPCSASHARLLSYVDPACMQALIPAWGKTVRVKRHLLPLVERHGLEALPAIKTALPRSDASKVHGDVLPLFARFVHPEAVRALLHQYTFDQTDQARTLLLVEPALTLAVLAEDRRRGKLEGLAEELARVRSLREAVLPHLSDGHQKRVKAWAGDAAEVEVAVRTFVKDLPAVLKTPSALRASWMKPKRLPLVQTPDGRFYERKLLPRFVELLAEDQASALEGHVDPATLLQVALNVEQQWAASPAPERVYGKSRFTYVQDDEEHGTGYWRRNRGVAEDVELPWPFLAVCAIKQPGAAMHLARRAIDWASRKKGTYRELVSLAVDEICDLPGDDAMEALDLIYSKVSTSRVRIDLYRARLAHARGMTLHEEKVLSLPDLAGGEPLVLDYGTRRFTAHVDAGLAAFVCDAEGERLSSLPRKRKSDDPAKVAEAKKAWKAFKTKARKTGTKIKRLLEHSLRRNDTRFHAPIFLQKLARHGVVGPLVATLIWRHDGGLFRVDESGEPVDLEDEPVSLSGSVQLAHPLSMTEAEREAWSSVLDDYGVLQPIPQLSREVYLRPETDERRIFRLAGKEIPVGGLFALKAYGWQWKVLTHAVHGREAGLYALQIAIMDKPIAIRAASAVEPSMPEGFHIYEVVATGGWADVSPIIYSEVVRDVLRACGQT